MTIINLESGNVLYRFSDGFEIYGQKDRTSVVSFKRYKFVPLNDIAHHIKEYAGD